MQRETRSNRLQSLACLTAATLLLACASTRLLADEPDAEATSEPDTEVTSESDGEATSAAAAPTHLTESQRSAIGKVVVLAGSSPESRATTGSYEKGTKGLIEGAVSGSEIGRGVGTEVGPVSMRIPIPILTWPGAIIGGITGMTKQQIQEFRDALTEDLAKAASQPLGSDSIASQVFWGLRRVTGVEPQLQAATTPISPDADAVLYISITDIAIDVQGRDAIITTTARATLRRLDDGTDIYDKPIHYQDRDTLSNWNRDDIALWRDYKNYARHYFGREIAGQTFGRVDLNHELAPRPTKNVKRVKRNDWQGVSKSLRPTLAWDLTLLGGDSYGAWTEALAAADIAFDVEIYDGQRLAYSVEQVQDQSHTVDIDLKACESYRWSVRPIYSVAGKTRFGEWMRIKPETYRGASMIGRQASKAPAYTQDFASLTVKCNAK